MLKYIETEEDLEGGYPTIPPSFKETEKILEVELVKKAVNIFAKEILIAENEISGKRIEWFLHSIFKFDIMVKEIKNNHFEILIPVGEECKIITFKINQV